MEAPWLWYISTSESFDSSTFVAVQAFLEIDKLLNNQRALLVQPFPTLPEEDAVSRDKRSKVCFYKRMKVGQYLKSDFRFRLRR
jgi:hypothetical protein